MALKAIMLRRSIDIKKAELESLRSKDADFKKREIELETAINEAKTQEEQETVSAEVDTYDAEKKAHDAQKKALEDEIQTKEQELSELEKNQEPELPSPETQQEAAKRSETHTMQTRAKFFGMNIHERDAFFSNQEVKDFLQRARDMGSRTEQRSIENAELGIPTVVLELIRQNVGDYSKLIRYVSLKSVSGKSRQNVMGGIPEAVWTEACASLNEIDFSFAQCEVDGYKVGGIICICKSTLEDSDFNLATEIISALGTAIGIALDKAILYGTGKKMPTGIVKRLAETQKPESYPVTARPWKDLHTSNVVNLGDKHGLELFKAIVLAAGNAKGKYSRSGKFWAMNDTTNTKLKVEAMNTNSAGLLTTAVNGKMPVDGGDIIILSDEVIPDNNIVGGYGDLYLLAERSGSQFERSDEYRFAEDQVVFKGTSRYDGKPVIPEGFVAMAINADPQSSATFAGDKANDASLKALQIGGETLSPTFESSKYAYAITATAESANINASPAQEDAKVTLEYQGNLYPNGSTIKWAADGAAHPLKIKVKNGASTLVYTVNLTKSRMLTEEMAMDERGTEEQEDKAGEKKKK